MFKIKGTRILLIRGDTLITEVKIKRNGEDYEVQPGDVVRFALKRSEMKKDNTAYLDEKPLITKIIPNESLILRLESEDTAKLPFGRYHYDIQLTMEDGTVDTFISNTLDLLAEVD